MTAKHKEGVTGSWFKRFTMLGCAALAMLPVAGAFGQEAFPSRPISLLIAQPPGATQDILGRLLGPLVSARAGQPVLVENRGGAAGVVALAATAGAKPDGYTICIVGSGGYLNALMTKDLSFDTAKDLTPIAYLTRAYTAWIVQPNSRFTSVAQMIAEAKAKPESVSYTSLGGGGRIMLARIENAIGLRFYLVPYNSGTQAVTAIMSGQVDVGLDNIGATRDNVKAGKVRALAVSSPGPLASLPGVPTISSVIPGVELLSWTGVFGPGGTPPDRVQWLNEAVNQALQNPKVNEAVLRIDQEPVPGKAADFAAFLARESSIAVAIIKQYKLTP